MNATARIPRLIAAAAALLVTFSLFQSVASLAEPSPAVELAQAPAHTIVLAANAH